MSAVEDEKKQNPFAVRIKICGLTRPEEIDYINDSGCDYCGFVIHVKKSRRSISPGQVRALVRGLSHEVIPVGVFQNEPVESVAALLLDGTIRAAQLHGEEDEAYIRRLREETAELGDITVIRAFHEETLQEAVKSSADLLLLDHGKGGTGETFDWSLAKQVRRPYFLAGGLGADNVTEALDRLHPFGVDMSSLVETDGRKDREKILEVVRRVRSWEKKAAEDIRPGKEK